MTTLTYTHVRHCAGGGHVVLDVSLDGAPARRFVYTTDEIRAPLSALTQEEREIGAIIIIKLHMRDKTRQQMLEEFDAGPVTVTV